MPNTEKIRQLNDAFRSKLSSELGKVLVTPGVAARDDVHVILRHIRAYDDWGADSDPYGERDFGSFKIGEQLIFFKIDYYDLDCQMGSPDPSDVTVTTRVLTVLLGEEY